MMEISRFTTKLDKVKGKNYVIEEEIAMPEGGSYEAELDHDSIIKETLSVYTGPMLTGTKIYTYSLSTPSLMPWKNIIRVQTTEPKVYISYETDGDMVEAEDVNNLQDAVILTQNELNAEVTRAQNSEEEIAISLNNEVERSIKKEIELQEDIEECKDELEDVSRKKHVHENKSIIDTITQALLDSWNAAVTHISDAVKHITATERINWNAAKSHADSAHAPSNAQKNSDITKAEIEAKLTGEITSHTHSPTGGGNSAKSLTVAASVPSVMLCRFEWNYLSTASGTVSFILRNRDIPEGAMIEIALTRSAGELLATCNIFPQKYPFSKIAMYKNNADPTDTVELWYVRTDTYEPSTNAYIMSMENVCTTGMVSETAGGSIALSFGTGAETTLPTTKMGIGIAAASKSKYKSLSLPDLAYGSAVSLPSSYWERAIVMIEYSVGDDDWDTKYGTVIIYRDLIYFTALYPIILFNNIGGATGHIYVEIGMDSAGYRVIHDDPSIHINDATIKLI
jgi:hypothetical protein